MHRYLSKIAIMKITEKTKKEVKKLQMGGTTEPMEPAQGAPVSEPGMEGGVDPLEQLLAMAAEAVQNQDGELALAVCQTLVESAQGGQGGGTPAPEGQPVYKMGGKLARRKKNQ